jgi:hypothetical protein
MDMSKEEQELAKIKGRVAITSAIPAVVYLIFYNIFSFIFFKNTDIGASIFGALVFWIMYFFMQILGIKNAEKKLKVRQKSGKKTS